MVSDLTGEKRIPPAEVKPGVIVRYARDNKGVLMGPDRYLGGWSPGAGHPAVLDRSTRHSNWGTAYAHMAANDQEALYDVAGTGKPDTNPLFERDLLDHPEHRQARMIARMRGENVGRPSPTDFKRQTKTRDRSGQPPRRRSA